MLALLQGFPGLAAPAAHNRSFSCTPAGGRCGGAGLVRLPQPTAAVYAAFQKLIRLEQERAAGASCPARRGPPLLRGCSGCVSCLCSCLFLKEGMSCCGWLRVRRLLVAQKPDDLMSSKCKQAPLIMRRRSTHIPQNGIMYAMCMVSTCWCSHTTLPGWTQAAVRGARWLCLQLLAAPSLAGCGTCEQAASQPPSCTLCALHCRCSATCCPRQVSVHCCILLTLSGCCACELHWAGASASTSETTAHHGASLAASPACPLE